MDLSSLPVKIGTAIAAALISNAYTLVKRQLDSRKAEKLAAETSFNGAINSDNLDTLANYLCDELGEVTTTAYLQDPKVRRRVDQYLTRLSDFVAAPEPDTNSAEAETDSHPEPEQLQTLENYWFDQISDPPEVKKALESVRAGESWNALARLRRDLELKIRYYAARVTGISNSERRNVRDLVPADAAPAFVRFWRTASRAVHGEPISDTEALRAIDDARQVYDILRQLELAEH